VDRTLLLLREMDRQYDSCSDGLLPKWNYIIYIVHYFLPEPYGPIGKRVPFEEQPWTVADLSDSRGKY
jgi:hypothetical protein